MQIVYTNFAPLSLPISPFLSPIHSSLHLSGESRSHVMHSGHPCYVQSIVLIPLASLLGGRQVLKTQEQIAIQTTTSMPIHHVSGYPMQMICQDNKQYEK